MDNQTKFFLLGLLVLILIYYLYNSGNKMPTTEHAKIQEHNVENFNNSSEGEAESVAGTEVNKEAVTNFPKQADYAPPESDWLKNKFNSRNRAVKGTYKASSYKEGIRGNLGSDTWKQYYDHNNNIIGKSQGGQEDQFLPYDESGTGFAVFRTKSREACGGNQDCPPESLFDVDKYLPQEVSDDYFETMPEPISVKNRHLINITKPIGINTIGSSNRNMSYDLRGAPSNPRFTASPWLQSSIEPDHNLKPLY